MSQQKISVLMAAINARAHELMGALETFDGASVTFSTARAAAMQGMVDAASVAKLAKNETGVTALGKLIRECETFTKAVAEGHLLPKTLTEYSQGAMRAYYHGVEWTPRLKNEPDMRLPWSKAPAKGAAPSTVVGSNASPAAKAAETAATGNKPLPRASLDALLRCALKALRDAGFAEVAAETLDAFLEIEGFTETPKAGK